MKKNIKNINTKRAGELAMRFASEKAERFYNNTDPLRVYEYETEDGLRYAYDGAFGEKEGLTLRQLERIFEEIQDEIDEMDEEAAR